MSKKESAPMFTKQQFLASDKFSTRQKDVLNALLKDGEKYSTQQVEQMVKEFLAKEVK